LIGKFLKKIAWDFLIPGFFFVFDDPAGLPLVAQLPHFAMPVFCEIKVVKNQPPVLMADKTRGLKTRTMVHARP
jgi:hypothetical protein